ncbi:hypothetical protein Gmet_3613 [Geobacter metallireducens GS-15]|uniref:Uncharacterized protein n=1 Tax=Geobacter metallireducens (strain ATCC 53774 / DSM 7210 / GS-15) TaxID=269799 RepID=J7M0A4_GEOMG|nr:hypothetical protein [Geobacter metallireducens]AFR42832.1 hypothetical protein Gmet_3613 [Geobacter metallireducens GS-15]
MSDIKGLPRYNVISFRVTDEEMKAMRLLKKKRKSALARLIREALSATDFPVNMDAGNECH